MVMERMCRGIFQSSRDRNAGYTWSGLGSLVRTYCFLTLFFHIHQRSGMLPKYLFPSTVRLNSWCLVFNFLTFTDLDCLTCYLLSVFLLVFGTPKCFVACPTSSAAFLFFPRSLHSLFWLRLWPCSWSWYCCTDKVIYHRYYGRQLSGC